MIELGIFRIQGKIGMLARINPMIVEFFAAIPVLYVSPIFATHGVILIIPGAEHRFCPFHFRIANQRHQTLSLQFFSLGKAAQCNEDSD